jgi:AcrR family transcriptional regulator
MSPKVPEAYLDARREEIILAAWNCFIEKGFHNTTMQDIYEATKLSPGAVYNYFASKDDIVAGAVAQFSNWSVASLASIISKHPRQPLYAAIRWWVATIKESQNPGFSVYLTLYTEAAHNEKIRATVLASQDTTHTVLIRAIKNGQRNGSINPGLDPLSVARTFMGILFGIMIHRMLEPDLDLDSYMEVCEAMLTGAFVAPLEKQPETAPSPKSRHPVKKSSNRNT